jgi:large subunit ribosomal protein L28
MSGFPLMAVASLIRRTPMPRACEYCGKKTQVGFQYTRRGLAKYKGGVGKKVTGRTKRQFRPNLQRVRALVEGSLRRVRICSRCIKSGKLTKPVRRAYQTPAKSPEVA